MSDPDEREQEREELNAMWHKLVEAEFLCRNCMHVTPDKAAQCRVCDKYDEMRIARDTALEERDRLKEKLDESLAIVRKLANEMRAGRQNDVFRGAFVMLKTVEEKLLALRTPSETKNLHPCAVEYDLVAPDGTRTEISYQHYPTSSTEDCVCARCGKFIAVARGGQGG